MPRRPILLLIGMAALALVSGGRGQGTGAKRAPRRPTTQLSYTEYYLPNGLRVLLAPDHGAPVVSVCVTYNVGSRDERPGQAGLAHLFEHLMSEGSANVGRGEHRLLIQETGGYQNAGTSEDTTEYYDTVPKNQADLALFLEADRMRSLDLTRENLEVQRAVVEAEKAEHHDVAFDAADTELLRLSYVGFAYGHPTIGERTDLESLSLADVRAFHATYYVPGNAVLCVAGDFREDEIRENVASWFGPIPAGPVPPPPDLAEPAPVGERRKSIWDQFSRLPRYTAGYRIVPGNHADFAALVLLGDILARGRRARLYRAMVGTRRALSVNAYAQERRGPGLFVITADLPAGPDLPQTFAAAEQEAETQIGQIQRAGVTPAELQKARNMERTDLVEQEGTAQGRARLLTRGASLYGDPGFANAWPSRLQAVTPEDVRRVADIYLRPCNRVVVDSFPTNT